MNNFAPDLTTIAEPVHTYNQVELEHLQRRYKELKQKVEKEGYELTLEDQRDILRWRRADRETKFILNQKPIKEKKVRVPKEPKELKAKKPKKITKKQYGALLLKELQGFDLTSEELEQRQRYEQGE